MKKNIIIIVLFSVVSFAVGLYMERKSQTEVRRQALTAAAKYMDSVQKINNNMLITFREVPYSRNLERSSSMINNYGYVPDAKAAARIAVSVWSSLYGEYIPQDYPPINISLKNDSVWIVVGTLLHNHEGGTPYIEISKANGTIYKVNHEK